MDRLSRLEVDLQHLSKSAALTQKGRCVCLSVPVGVCFGAQNKGVWREKEGELVGLRASSCWRGTGCVCVCVCVRAHPKGGTHTLVKSVQREPPG